MPGNFSITVFDYRKEAKPGELTDLAWGEALNTGDEDYVGIIIIDRDTQEQMQVLEQPTIRQWLLQGEFVLFLALLA